MKKIEEEITRKIADLKKYPYECFTVDEHGRASDAAFHAAVELLLHPAAEERMLAATREIERALDEVRERARSCGWSEEMIEREYGKPRPKDVM
jgi:hypothetical protein